MRRIVSLIPSATEIVYKLGFGQCLVGRSHSCDYPEPVNRLPICTSPSFDIEGTSGEIDDRVQHSLIHQKPLYLVFDEVLKGLDPDIIITQVQCDVCAVSLDQVHRSVCSWSDFNAELVSMKAVDLEGIFEDIKAVSHALGDLKRGDELVGLMKDEMARLSERAHKIAYSPRVACVEWIDPVMMAANWVPELINMSAVSGLFGRTGEHSYRMAWEKLVQADPDVLIFMACGFDIQKTKEELFFLTKKEDWFNLRAVRNHQVYVTDGKKFFNRPAPTVLESFQILLEILYPKDFQFEYLEKRWESFEIETLVSS